MTLKILSFANNTGFNISDFSAEDDPDGDAGKTMNSTDVLNHFVSKLTSLNQMDID